jgi:hypothetical protein
MNVRADGSRPLHYHWLKDGDEFSNDTLMTVHIDNFKSGNEGTYICIVSNNCGYDTTKQAVISIAPSICMVTVTDPVAGKSGHNLIIFEKESKIPYSKFKIYRESSVEGYYDSIGSVLSANPGIFEDTLVNPKDQAYLYKITGVKADNSETDITSGKLHKTIHLMVTKGEMGGIQLDWDQYIGFPYTTYYIERSTDGIHFSTAHKMASSTRTWTDDTIVGSNDTLYYYISVMKEDSCYPMGRKKGGSDIYSQSISNLEDNRLQNSGITKTNIDNLNLSCFPNPFKYNATISYYLQTASKVSVEIYNTLGERIATLVDMKQPAGYNEYRLNVHEILQKPGVFYLRLKVGNSMSTKKLIKI